MLASRVVVSIQPLKSCDKLLELGSKYLAINLAIAVMLKAVYGELKIGSAGWGHGQ